VLQVGDRAIASRHEEQRRPGPRAEAHGEPVPRPCGPSSTPVDGEPGDLAIVIDIEDIDDRHRLCSGLTTVNSATQRR
jgi:hypothetical protein